jgi:hypothetical protein
MRCKFQALNVRKNRNNLTFWPYDSRGCAAVVVQVRVGPVSCAYSRLVIPVSRSSSMEGFERHRGLHSRLHQCYRSTVTVEWLALLLDVGQAIFFLWWIRPSGFFPFRINLKLRCILRTEGISTSQGRYLNRTTQISMPQVGLEHTIPAFERAKTFRTLDNADKIQIFNLRCLSFASLNEP